MCPGHRAIVSGGTQMPEPTNPMAEASEAVAESPHSIAVSLETCLRLENLLLKKTLKQRELHEIEQLEAALHSEIMRQYGVEGRFAVDLTRQCLVPRQD
jgi:hypothetical protein